MEHGVSLSMPPSNFGKKKPLVRPASSRKRKETRRAVENADPLLPKNKRLKTSVKGIRPHQDTDTKTHLSQSTRKSVVDLEEDSDDVNEVDDVVPSMNVLGQVLDDLGYMEADDENDEESIIDVDEIVAASEAAEESAEAELSRLVTL
jgi:hypothetical protein